jgi:hypothetical protein
VKWGAKGVFCCRHPEVTIHEGSSALSSVRHSAHFHDCCCLHHTSRMLQLYPSYQAQVTGEDGVERQQTIDEISSLLGERPAVVVSRTLITKYHCCNGTFTLPDAKPTKPVACH